MPLSINDLKIGDIVFYTPSYTNEMADHVAIVTRLIPENNQCYVTHAVTITDKYNEVIETLLRLDEKNRYFIYRCQDDVLTKNVGELAKSWGKKGIKFSKDRHDLMLRAEEHFGVNLNPKNVKKHLEYVKASYNDNKFFSIIKYAARRNTRPSLNKGFRCDQFVILVIQVAEVGNRVDDLNALGVPWITDKHGERDYLNLMQASSDWADFTHYFNKLREGNEYNEFQLNKSASMSRQVKQLPSLYAWNSDVAKEDAKEYFLSSDRFLPLDSKISSPSVLLTYLNDNPKKWKNLGEYIGIKNTYTNREKLTWKEFLQEIKDSCAVL